MTLRQSPVEVTLARQGCLSVAFWGGKGGKWVGKRVGGGVLYCRHSQNGAFNAQESAIIA